MFTNADQLYGLHYLRTLIVWFIFRPSYINNFLCYLPLTLREESRLRVFENRILRRIYGPKRDDNGEWRRLHNEELYSLYLEEIGINAGNWVDSAQDRNYWRALVNAALNLRVP